MKIKLVAVTLVSITLGACGGGGSSSNSNSGNGASSSGGNSGSGTPSTSNPVTTGYLDFSYLQNVNGTPASTTSNIVDKGQNNANAITFYNGSATVTTTSGGYVWGAPLTAGVGIETAANNSNVPSIIELCENVAGNSTTKSVDVLIQATATAITNATGLSNTTFSTYHEDCGASANAVGGGSTLVFDANGNATLGSVTLAASEVTSMLNGTPNTTALTSLGGGYLTFNAYSYKTAYGTTGSAIIMHAAPSTTNVTKGIISVWTK